jgi:sugar lactone lactonase YvrE
VDSLTGEAWVTSATTGWVWRFASDNTVLDSLRLASPVGVALDWRRRTAWVADAQAGQLVGIDMDTRLVRIRIAALAQAYDVAVDLDRGEPWVVVRGTASLYRFAPDGRELGRVNGLGDPWEIRLDRGRL